MPPRTWRDELADKCRVRSLTAREFMAEFLGTFVLLAFGDGVVAQVVLSNEAKGGFITINWCWGLAVALAVHTCGGVSGAHINPAVTISYATIGRFPWQKVPHYITAQFLGAFSAAGCVYGIYYDAITAFEGGTNRTVIGETATAGIFATYPQDFISIWTGLFDQIFATGLLLLCILALIDTRNDAPPKGMEPYLIGLVVAAIGMSFGFNCGYAINPARDFGPRVWTAVAGYGPEVWVYNGIHWYWVPIVGPIIGGILGSLVYVALIENHHPPEEMPLGETYGMEPVAVTRNGDQRPNTVHE